MVQRQVDIDDKRRRAIITVSFQCRLFESFSNLYSFPAVVPLVST